MGRLVGMLERMADSRTAKQENAERNLRRRTGRGRQLFTQTKRIAGGLDTGSYSGNNQNRFFNLRKDDP